MSFTNKTITNFLSKEECEAILNFSFDNLKLIPAEIISRYKEGLDNDMRKSNIVFYPYYQKFPFLLEKMTKVLNDTINVKGFDLDYEHSEFQFTEYNTGDFFSWHKDNDAHVITEFNRYCSIVIQLNDDYVEGDLQIKIGNDTPIVVEKGTGNLIIFSSDILHRVTPVASGKRYTLVNWVGIKEKINNKKTLL